MLNQTELAYRKQCSEYVKLLREANYPYSKIARILGMSLNTVKSICRRKGIHPQITTRPAEETSLSLICKYYGKPLDLSHYSRRKFCSDTCRYRYWNDRPK